MATTAFLVGLVIAFAAGRDADAQSRGYYLPTGRSNDPFVFCTEGMPAHGWIAISPAQGTCQAISQYVNYQWIPTYTYSCPKAFGQGLDRARKWIDDAFPPLRRSRQLCRQCSGTAESLKYFVARPGVLRSPGRNRVGPVGGLQ